MLFQDRDLLDRRAEFAQLVQHRQAEPLRHEERVPSPPGLK
ncbi:hypothetical protein ACFVWP_32715 [Streptomyces sp. NPDC058175]